MVISSNDCLLSTIEHSQIMTITKVHGFCDLSTSQYSILWNVEVVFILSQSCTHSPSLSFHYSMYFLQTIKFGSVALEKISGSCQRLCEYDWAEKQGKGLSLRGIGDKAIFHEWVQISFHRCWVANSDTLKYCWIFAKPLINNVENIYICKLRSSRGSLTYGL